MNIMNFKEWFYFTEAIDQNTEKALKQQKVDPNDLNDFINQLKNQPEFIDTKSAFSKLQEKFPFLKKDKNQAEAPTDPFFKQYYDQLASKQITKPEYYCLLFFKDQNKNLLSEMMQSLRNLIQKQKIQLTFNNNIPTIVYRNEPISSKDFVQFNATLHGIEGQNTTQTSNKNLADPFFLEVSHKEKLVAKNSDGTIWVFKATGPLDCRLMGKGQSWCISSSSSDEWYFEYRNNYGQTQYFIFDFNKDEDDPARYVNPGIAQKDEYSEWVDVRNEANSIKGYSSIKDYKNYLKSQGIDTNVFVANPLTEEELSKLDEDMIVVLLKSYKNPDELINQILPLFKDKLNGSIINYLLHYSSNPDELINQILPLVKDKLDKYMVDNLLHYSSNKDEMINQIFPLVKDKLDASIINYLLRYSSNKDETINQILPLVKDKLNTDMVWILLFHSKNKDETIRQILPLVKDNLDGEMLHYLLDNSSNRNKILPLVKDKLDKDMVDNLLHYSSNKDEMINLMLPYLQDKLDKDMVRKLSLKKKIHDIKIGDEEDYRKILKNKRNSKLKKQKTTMRHDKNLPDYLYNKFD